MAEEPRGVVERALDRATRAGVAGADATLIEGDSLQVRVRGESIDFVKQAREQILGLRVFVAGGSGQSSATASTSDLSREAVERLVDETLALARATAVDPAAGLHESGFAADIPDLDLFEPTDHPVDAESRIALARSAESAARAVDPRIVNSEGSQASASFGRVTYGNTAGFLGSYERASHSLYSAPLARENGSMQVGSWVSAGRRAADLEAPEVVGRRAAERALRQLGARRVPTCEVAVIFDPFTAPSLLRQIAGCASGQAVYRGTSFLAGRVGEMIGSDLVHVVDDGRLPGGLGSRPFDGEGLPTRRNVLIDRGRLGGYLLDTYSARKLGLESTGSAARGAVGAPVAAPTNLWLEPGSQSFEELVASTERGLLVTQLIGQGFNPLTGDYSRGAAGIWIEGGRLTHAVEEVTIAGNLGDMLSGVDGVADDLRWRGATASPSLRVARMTVAGD